MYPLKAKSKPKYFSLGTADVNELLVRVTPTGAIVEKL
jgi:hypothetical protein